MALLPDPAPRARQHVLISVDDHVIEPPDMFDGRLPARLADQAPRIVEADDGRQVWRYEDREYLNIGLNAVIGRPLEEWSMEFDAATVDHGPERTRYDLPAAAPRLVADTVEVCRDGVATAAMPGTVLRSGRDTQTVPAT
jgi:hypothetical protein